VSTLEDRQWDAERDRAWLCPECGADEHGCDCQEGWLIDEDTGDRFGHCNSFGEEAREFDDCCDDGEVVPYEVTP
jgi:hypothetical protein